MSALGLYFNCSLKANKLSYSSLLVLQAPSICSLSNIFDNKSGVTANVLLTYCFKKFLSI